MTLQEAFDRAFIGLRAQGFERAYSKEANACVHLAKDGKRCAVGHMLSEEQAANADELGVVWGRCQVFPNDSSLRDKLAEIQGLHDHHSRPATMEAELRRFAVVNGLTVPE